MNAVRALTKADKARGDKLKELGCIVCRHFIRLESPCEIHHLDGKTKKACHQKTIGLCPNHHRIKSNDNIWTSLHGNGRKAFEERYASEQEMLDLTNELIGE